MRIKNWHKFQHFKDRRPPWIKLYRDILDDPEWYTVSGDDAKVLIMLWLIASEDGGELPDNKTLAFRLRTSEKIVAKSVINLSHWLDQADINLISARYQPDKPETEESREETETEDMSVRSVIIGKWNAIAAVYDIPSISMMTDKRWKKYRQRIKEGMDIDKITERIHESSFLQGGNGKWTIQFDWLVENSDNWAKVQEGKYADKGKTTTKYVDPAGRDGA